MNQPRSLSTEMTQYITKGTCPRCGVVILSPDYIRQHRVSMHAQVENFQAFTRRWGDILAGLVDDPLTPAGAKVEASGINGLKCLTCMKSWSFYPLRLSPAVRQALFNARPVVKPPTASQAPAASSTGPIIRTTTARPAANINVANYRLLGVKDEQRTETVLRKETKTYPNESSGRITPKVSVTDSVTRSVTIETNKIQTSGGQAGVQILGFATIQGQIQQQLGQRYAVEVQRTLTVSEEVQVEVPPHKAIELSITWKMEWLQGTAILGPILGTARMEAPYFIPHRLTFDWRTRDVPLTE